MVLGEIVWLIGLVCAVWVIYDVFSQQRGMDTVEKVLWTIAAILFSIITAIVYWFVKKR